jgi:hypothetical protein
MRKLRMPLRAVAATVCVAVVAAAVQVVGAPAAHAAGPLVGVLPSYDGTCPGGAPKYTVAQDNEDDNNENSRSGWIGGVQSDRNTHWYVCAVDGDRFVNLLSYRVNFAVLMLASSCPSGSRIVYRYVDDEDDNNQSYSILPAFSPTFVSEGNTTFRFCWFLNYSGYYPAPTSSNFPDLGGEYGVFGPGDQPGAIQSGWVHTDDEDNDNRNWVTTYYSILLTAYQAQWLTADRNSTYRMIRVR